MLHLRIRKETVCHRGTRDRMRQDEALEAMWHIPRIPQAPASKQSLFMARNMARVKTERWLALGP